MYIDKWTLEIDISPLDTSSASYIRQLPEAIPGVQWVWNEMDRIWDEVGLDNRKPISVQDIGKFYGHPVWIMNGLFTEIDPESKAHRFAIATYLAKMNKRLVADYGGGSGVLAKELVSSNDQFVVDIVEPYAFDFFKRRLASFLSVRYVNDFKGVYDVVIAQDVLEHVDNPVEIAYKISSHVRDGGLIVFANCFFPCIKCHLPETFYLRHTFRTVMEAMGLQYIESVPGAAHALVFRKDGMLDVDKALTKARFFKSVGIVVNSIAPAVARLKRVLK